MALLTVEQAAARLNRTPRTIRRWITEEHKLTEYHPPHGHTGKYLVDESEVEQLAGELAQYEQPAEQGPAASEDIEKRLKYVEGWVSDLQRWYNELDARINALEQGVSSRAGTDGEASPLPLQRATEQSKRGRPVGSVKAETPKEIPSGSLLMKEFAELHGVPSMTFRDHVKKGRYGEQVAAIKVFKRETAKGPEYEYWLSPDQQKAALEFWQRHNVAFTLPSEQEQEETP